MRVVQRRNLHVRVSDEAYRGFVGFANESGVTVTALLEAGGLLLGHAGAEPTIGDLVDLARRVDREHRSRRD